ncbi:hypothetical protein IFM89_013524 [Coptis chinensis]|uniref:Uncharacterized protein n=1 Tax=Coptis chinensis TaxID=261450 RepID=A0A835LE90_9MAGN|nr:hypothetical protein IFM89_013524 [Coptis chinensis]
MNSFLSSQEKSKEQNVLHQDKLASLGLGKVYTSQFPTTRLCGSANFPKLGPKVRSYLLMLLRMHRLVVETVDGSVVYRVL